MTPEIFMQRLDDIPRLRCETPALEFKSAHVDCPKRLYDTLSSFSNQDDGGLIIFGIDEQQEFAEVGVYDPQDLQKKVNEQCLQMEPEVRPLFTVVERDGKVFVAAEIPGIDVSERPCFYKGKGRLKGSYVRIGDSDEPMTEYEVYSYEAYRKKLQDDVRSVERASMESLNRGLLQDYIERLKSGRPNLSTMMNEAIYELMSVTRDGVPTMGSVLMFGIYPQAYFPQLCITAIVVPGTEVGDVGNLGERFADNQRIEGTIPEMLSDAVAFVQRNMRKRTIIDPDTGERKDRTDYPVEAIREAVLNALVHRDYSSYTEGMPIQLILYDDRMEIRSPGGLYGRIAVDQLGKVQPDTRNPVLVKALECLGITENRYSGIPTIRRAMEAYNLAPAEFVDERGAFVVKFYREPLLEAEADISDEMLRLIDFCQTPRTRAEICQHLGVGSASYAIKTYIMPLVERGDIALEFPDKPRSRYQRYHATHR